MVARVVYRMTRPLYRHTLLISHFPARAYVDKGDFPVPLIYPLGKACIHPARQAAGNSAKDLVKFLFFILDFKGDLRVGFAVDVYDVLSTARLE